jgi:hypothetical protein
LCTVHDLFFVWATNAVFTAVQEPVHLFILHCTCSGLSTLCQHSCTKSESQSILLFCTVRVLV